jgi:hypothetical protein
MIVTVLRDGSLNHPVRFAPNCRKNQARRAAAWVLGLTLFGAATYAQDQKAEEFDRFGSALARGDFNGDGFDDLAVGVPSEGICGDFVCEDPDQIERQRNVSGAGAVDVIYGTANGLAYPNRQFWRPGIGNLQGAPQEFENFGYTLAAGDFNRDGFSDLAIGAPGNAAGGANAGAVYVLYGSTTGLLARTTVRQKWSQRLPVLQDQSEYGDRFGASLATGDFDRDGFLDLAVGVPNETVVGMQWAGAVNVIYGSALGLSETATARRRSFWHQSICTMRPCRLDIGDGLEAGDAFGWSLAAGDFNADGIDDLAVGVPCESVAGVWCAGAVNVILGSASGLTTVGSQIWHQDSAGIEDQAEPGDRFGVSLAAGDFNFDSRVDLAIGVPDEALRIGTTNILQAGAVNVIYGSSLGLTATGNQFWYQGRDGLADQPESFDHFGEAIAAGDFNADGTDDLAIGVPTEDLGSAWDTGAVNVLYGFVFPGLTAAGNQFWHQDVPYVEGTNEIGNRFGLTLATGRFNGARYSSLAIGIPWDHVLSATGSIAQAGAVEVIYGSEHPRFVPGLNAVFPVPDQIWTQIVIRPPNIP